MVSVSDTVFAKGAVVFSIEMLINKKENICGV
jgi:hypothetical protein